VVELRSITPRRSSGARRSLALRASLLIAVSVLVGWQGGRWLGQDADVYLREAEAAVKAATDDTADAQSRRVAVRMLFVNWMRLTEHRDRIEQTLAELSKEDTAVGRSARIQLNHLKKAKSKE
jgi:hypothetical protein